MAEVPLPASKMAPLEDSGHPPFKSTTAAFVWCYMAVTFPISSLARLHEVMSCYIKPVWDMPGQGTLTSKTKAQPEIAMSSSCNPQLHLGGTYLGALLPVVSCMCSHPITFKAPSQLAAIFNRYSDLAGEVSKLAAVLSVALQFP